MQSDAWEKYKFTAKYVFSHIQHLAISERPLDDFEGFNVRSADTQQTQSAV
jgi:hypothetical protein